MSQSDFAEQLLERVRERQGRYHQRAYLFVLAALEYCQARLPERRHISGEELARACREFALEQFGLLARTVLEHWGVGTTDDIGEIVFALIDAGLLIRQPTDRRQDFCSLFEFGAAFEASYPWGRAGGGGRGKASA